MGNDCIWYQILPIKSIHLDFPSSSQKRPKMVQLTQHTYMFMFSFFIHCTSDKWWVSHWRITNNEMNCPLISRRTRYWSPSLYRLNFQLWRSERDTCNYITTLKYAERGHSYRYFRGEMEKFLSKNVQRKRTQYFERK